MKNAPYHAEEQHQTSSLAAVVLHWWHLQQCTKSMQCGKTMGNKCHICSIHCQNISMSTSCAALTLTNVH